MKPRVNRRASVATKHLEYCWAMLREIEPSIPAAVFVIMSAKRRGKIFGHFTPLAWRNQHGPRTHEIAISSDLFWDPEDLLTILLHEAAHAILRKKQGGCRPDSCGYLYYHRKEFRNTCFRLGLDCEFYNNRYGWSITHWPRETGVHQKYKSITRYLSSNLPLGTEKGKRHKLIDVRGKNTPHAGLTKITCGCKESQRNIYVNKSILTRGGIICELCGLPFQKLKR